MRLFSSSKNSPPKWIVEVSQNLRQQSVGPVDTAKKCRVRVGAEYSRKANARTQADAYGREYGGLICCRGGTVRATEPHPGPIPERFSNSPSGRVYSYAEVNPRMDDTIGKRRRVSCSDVFWWGGIEVATYHSHPTNSSFQARSEESVDRNGMYL